MYLEEKEEVTAEEEQSPPDGRVPVSASKGEGGGKAPGPVSPKPARKN